MAIGPHVYGNGRVGCWFTNSVNFRDKLKHRLPLVKVFATDAFLPREATLTDKQEVLNVGMFSALYETPPHGMSAVNYANQAVADTNRLKVGATELNIEGIGDAFLSTYVSSVVAEIRKTKPGLRLRINIVPYKGKFLPVQIFVDDPQLYIIVQNYLGNMDARVPEDEITRDLTDRGIPPAKVSVMYGAHISPGNGKARVPALPQIRSRGSIYTDDLLADAGYIS